jgi:hypothetical protein
MVSRTCRVLSILAAATVIFVAIVEADVVTDDDNDVNDTIDANVTNVTNTYECIAPGTKLILVTIS